MRGLFFLPVLLLIGPAVYSEKIEVSPLVGLRFGGNLENAVSGESMTIEPSESVGASASIKMQRPLEWAEIQFSRQTGTLSGSGSMDNVGVQIDYLQAGILREYSGDAFRPFLVGLLGASFFEFSNASLHKTLFSVGAGGGFKYFISDWLGLRSELKAFLSFVEGNKTIYCNGGCEVSFSGSTFWQGEITQSLVVKF